MKLSSLNVVDRTKNVDATRRRNEKLGSRRKRLERTRKSVNVN